MRAVQGRGEELELEAGDGVAGGGELLHEDAPLGRVALRGPVLVRVRVGRVKWGHLERDHLQRTGTSR